MKTLLTLGLFFVASLLPAAVGASDAPAIIPLWTGAAPGSEGKTGEEVVRLSPDGEHIVAGVHRPTLIGYLPTKDLATGAAVVICPGGGHRELWTDHEGHAVGRWLAAHGIAGFVLKYRLAREPGSTYRVEVESLAAAQRAVRLVRSRAAEWNLDPARVGIIGFSAGGEVAALTSRRFDRGAAEAADPIDRQDSKPAFQGLIYPGNTKAIAPDKDSPPAFLLCGYDDRPDIAEELARVYLRFKQAGMPAELHIYTGAGHGFGLRASNKFPAGQWLERFRDWLADRGFLGKTP